MDYVEYVEAPLEIGLAPDECWMLKKALNGIKRASHMFQNFLIGLLKDKFNFKQCPSLPTLLATEPFTIAMTIHVDDPLAIGKDELTIRSLLENWVSVAEGQDWAGHG